MQKFPGDAPKARVLRTLRSLGFEIVREREHISMRRINPDGSATPLTLPNHATIKGSTLRTVWPGAAPSLMPMLYPSGRSSASNEGHHEWVPGLIDPPRLSSGLAHGAFKKTMRNTPTVGSDQFVEELILTVRGRRVILAGDLAGIYGVDAKRLNEQVRRSSERFPADFVFRLAREEFELLRTRGAIGADGRVALRSQNATLKRGRHVKYPPYAFTEHGEPAALPQARIR